MKNGGKNSKMLYCEGERYGRNVRSFSKSILTCNFIIISPSILVFIFVDVATQEDICEEKREINVSDAKIEYEITSYSYAVPAKGNPIKKDEIEKGIGDLEKVLQKQVEYLKQLFNDGADADRGEIEFSFPRASVMTLTMGFPSFAYANGYADVSFIYNVKDFENSRGIVVQTGKKSKEGIAPLEKTASGEVSITIENKPLVPVGTQDNYAKLIVYSLSDSIVTEKFDKKEVQFFKKLGEKALELLLPFIIGEIVEEILKPITNLGGSLETESSITMNVKLNDNESSGTTSSKLNVIVNNDGDTELETKTGPAPFFADYHVDEQSSVPINVSLNSTAKANALAKGKFMEGTSASVNMFVFFYVTLCCDEVESGSRFSAFFGRMKDEKRIPEEIKKFDILSEKIDSYISDARTKINALPPDLPPDEDFKKRKAYYMEAYDNIIKEIKGNGNDKK